MLTPAPPKPCQNTHTSTSTSSKKRTQAGVEAEQVLNTAGTQAITLPLPA